MSARPATEPQTRRLTISELVGRFSSASNATYLGTDPHGELWVYKPTAGVRSLWDFPPRSLAAREIMAYEVSNRMELGLVPQTLEADGPLGPGAAQRFLRTDSEFDQRDWFDDGTDPCLWPVAVFDLVANNADRKLGHLLIESSSGKLFAIDHGLTFHQQEKLRTVLWGFAGLPLPPTCVQALEKLDRALSGPWAGRAEELLLPEEVRALHRRTRRLLDDPNHPHPPPDRAALPWPLW